MPIFLFKRRYDIVNVNALLALLGAYTTTNCSKVKRGEHAIRYTVLYAPCGTSTYTAAVCIYKTCLCTYLRSHWQEIQQRMERELFLIIEKISLQVTKE